MSNARAMVEEGRGRRRRTVPNAPQIGQHAIGPTAAWYREGRVVRIVACEVEEVLELGRGEVEPGESVVALGAGRQGASRK
jgi:hypothetical protein